MKILSLIENDIKKHILKYNKYIDKCSIKEFSREIYLNGNIYIEGTIEIIFLINTGDWFNKTIRFDIKINTYENKIFIRNGYGSRYKKYNKKDIKKVLNFINKRINEFYLKNNMEIIKYKKIV